MVRRRNKKSGIDLKIPGFGDRHIQTLVTDYDGTLSCHGGVTDQTKQQLMRLAAIIDIHILTADRKVKSNDCFGELPVRIHILSGKDQDVQKRDYLENVDPAHVAAFGNGNNDRLLLQAVKNSGGLSVAVENGEGCAVETLLSAHLLVRNAQEALDILLNPDRFTSTLRY
jgi:soluble P-type ATPase